MSETPVTEYPTYGGRFSYEDKQWRKLMRDLDKFSVAEWQVLGSIGVGYPNSLYKLFVHRGGQAAWWLAETSVHQISLGVIKAQRAHSAKWATPSHQIVDGPATLLVGLTCHPGNPGLVKLLAEFQRRLAAK